MAARHQRVLDHDVVTARAAQPARVPGIEYFQLGAPEKRHAGLGNVRLQHAWLPFSSIMQRKAIQSDELAAGDQRPASVDAIGIIFDDRRPLGRVEPAYRQSRIAEYFGAHRGEETPKETRQRVVPDDPAHGSFRARE